jgi:PAS domain S-box-containing protein
MLVLAVLAGGLAGFGAAVLWLRRETRERAQRLAEQERRTDEQARGLELRTGSQRAMSQQLDASNAALRASLLTLERARIERAASERQHAESASLLEMVSASAPLGLAIVDRGGRVQRANDVFARIAGVMSEAMVDRPLRLMLPELASQLDSAMAPAVESGTAVTGIDVAWSTGGEGTRHWLVNVFPIRAGTVEPVIGVVTLETTERKLLEAELFHAQKLEAVGTFAGGISHEFNNILGGIIGYGELVRAEVLDRRQVAADLEELLLAAQRGRELVERILTFTRSRQPEVRPLDLGRAVTDVRRLIRATAPPNVDVRVHVDPTTPRIAADAALVRQMVLHLARNAVQAMPDGGALDISVEGYYLGDSAARARPTLREGPHVVLTVRDTGTGMDAETREHAFEPFFTTKPRGAGGGSGLGLTVVHSIMRDFHGAVELESAPDSGTTVRCLFPALPVAGSDAVSLGGGAPRARGEHVLCIDDEESLVLVARRRLEALGYRVTTVTDPHRAIELVRDPGNAFDIVLTDYLMPRLTGLDVAAEISRLAPDLPIVLVTGYLEDLDDDRLRAAGIRRLAKKPLTARQLAEVVRGALDQSPGDTTVR